MENDKLKTPKRVSEVAAYASAGVAYAFAAVSGGAFVILSIRDGMEVDFQPELAAPSFLQAFLLQGAITAVILGTVLLVIGIRKSN